MSEQKKPDYSWIIGIIIVIAFILLAFYAQAHTDMPDAADNGCTTSDC